MDPELRRQVEEIETLIRARYPILYIVTWEERKIERILADVARRRGKKVYTWSITQGIQPLGAAQDAGKARNSGSRDPAAALDQVAVSMESALFLFRDMHPFLTKNNFAVIRRLREVAQSIKNSYKTLVVISPVLELEIFLIMALSKLLKVLL